MKIELEWSEELITYLKIINNLKDYVINSSILNNEMIYDSIDRFMDVYDTVISEDNCKNVLYQCINSNDKYLYVFAIFIKNLLNTYRYLYDNPKLSESEINLNNVFVVSKQNKERINIISINKDCNSFDITCAS